MHACGVHGQGIATVAKASPPWPGHPHCSQGIATIARAFPTLQVGTVCRAAEAQRAAPRIPAASSFSQTFPNMVMKSDQGRSHSNKGDMLPHGGDVMFWQGWLVGNGIMCSIPVLPGQEGWVGAFSYKRLPGTGALLSALGPSAQLILQVILRLPLTSSPHSQH